ncbi:unnamed protein product [Triticum turgidum subsp. durum]|uniref:Uncharacterized protein n=1 Tax=Triticum turgidum subsp. durum TaxID=4567 RepID=A0A9R0R8J5_TRITD|nr:unnamed protein product [Triticum turgidum subsp. durum]
MKRTRAQNPKAQDPEPQDPAAAGSNPNPKPQRRAKQPRQPKAAATAGKKTAAARDAAAVAATAAAAAATSVAAASPAAEMAPVVPDVCVAAGGGGGGEVACGLPAEWDEMDGANGSPWWTFGVEEEKLLGWFPFVEEDFLSIGGVGPAAAEPSVFDDDIWRIHQIYEIPSYAAK